MKPGTLFVNRLIINKKINKREIGRITMRKILMIIIGLGLFLLLTSEKSMKFCKKIINCNRNSHVLQQDEYYKNLSQYYYGTPSYSEELSMVNNPVHELSDNDLIIPSYEAITRLKYEQNISITNEIKNTPPTKADRGIISNKNYQKSSIIYLVLIGIILSVILMSTGNYLRRQRKADILLS